MSIMTMKIWISIRRKKKWKGKSGATSFHFDNPEWVEDESYVDDGYWQSAKTKYACCSWSNLLPSFSLPRRPRELLETEVAAIETWEWK